MNSQNPIVPKRRFKNGVAAALEICAERRAHESGIATAFGDSGRCEAVERTAAIVEADARRLEAGDFGALQAVCASQVLALDVIFNQFARESAQWASLSHGSMKMALKAQSQCRATVKALVALANPRPVPRGPGESGEPRKKSRPVLRSLGEGGNFDERTIGNEKRKASSMACRIALGRLFQPSSGGLSRVAKNAIMPPTTRL